MPSAPSSVFVPRGAPSVLVPGIDALLLVAFLFLVVRPGDPSSVLVPSDALCS